MNPFPAAFEISPTALVVIAPHPDDDVLGCGALIARVAPHMPVRVVYVTDGTASHNGSTAYPPQRLRVVREREAMRALRKLGVHAIPRFLRWPDGTVPSAGDPAAAPLVRALRKAIPAGEDLAVAVPWRRDPHCDHRAVTSLVADVLRERPRAAVFEYAVWAGIIGEPADEPTPFEGRMVDVDSRPWLPAKRAAIREHKSQLGELITDAETAFKLPDALLARALASAERFIIPAGAQRHVSGSTTKPALTRRSAGKRSRELEAVS
jgi:LmbE family N-acetylglucosaminyl deacetylase